AVQVTNLFGSTNSAVAVLTVNPIPACAPVLAGMVGWWAGEDNANDVISTNNGTLVGDVTFTNGEVGQAFYFNGSDYVSIPDGPQFDDLTTNLTVEFWMKWEM